MYSMDVSVIICTYNRAELVVKTLSSLAQLRVDPSVRWEVIVVDNNSTDETNQAVSEFIAHSHLNARYVFEGRQGLSYARNRGVGDAKGRIISFLDDDVVVDRSWLEKVIEGFRNHDPMVLCGRVLLDMDGQVPGWIPPGKLAPLGAHDIGSAVIVAESDRRQMFGIGANMCFKSEAFQRYGLFDIRLGRIGNNLMMGEETALFWKIQDDGQKCVYYPDALVWTHILPERLERNYFRRWYFRIGEWQAFEAAAAKKKDESIRLLGVPGWMFKDAANNILAYLRAALAGRKVEAEDKMLALITFLGYFAFVQKARWSAVRSFLICS